jgi:hypothetical protein
MDQEILPVSVYQAFIDGLDSCLIPGFHTYFRNYSKSQDCATIHQCKVLEEMHQAALCAKREYNNIRVIASKVNGFGGQAFSTKVNTSQAEKTIKHYSSSDNTGSNKSLAFSWGSPCCYGCGEPHPWSLLENGIHVIKCPNPNNPGIIDNAKKVIERICNKCKKKQLDFTKCKNLTTTNYSNFDKAGKEPIQQQVLNSVSIASESTSVASSITGVTGSTLVPSHKKE